MAMPCAAVRDVKKEAWFSQFLLLAAFQQSCLGITTENKLPSVASEHLSSDPSACKKGFVGCDLMTVREMEERDVTESGAYRRKAESENQSQGEEGKIWLG